MQIKMYLEHVKDLQKYADRNFPEHKTRSSEFMGYERISGYPLRF